MLTLRAVSVASPSPHRLTRAGHFDDFTWGATRIVIGEGKNKRVLAGADDEPYDDGMIPMRRYADYRQAAFDHSGAGSSDAYDTKSLAPSMIQPPSHAKHASRQSRSSQLDLLSHTRAPSYASFGQMPMVGTPVLRPPQMMMMPGPYGYAWPQSLQGSMIGGATGGSASGSDAGSVARGPIMMPTPFMSPAAPSILSAAAGRHMSSYSLASAAAFSPPPMQPSASTDPSDDEIVYAVRTYLSMQDLMQVTKRSACGRRCTELTPTAAREAMSAFFPAADLGPRRDFINACVDKFVQGQL